MKYFLDTEFLEGTQKKLFGETKPIIDLISIGIVCEDGREYYAISKDFNLKEAWNRYDKIVNKQYPLGPKYNNSYWIRDNVLKSIWEVLVNKFALEEYKANLISCTVGYNPSMKFTYKNFKKLINKYGKTNKQIAEEIKVFVANRGDNKTEKCILEYEYSKDVPEFYGYYCDYDWVVFCWLFGKMIDLPKGFPMYCIDLKQISDEVLDKLVKEENNKAPLHNTGVPKWKKFIDNYDIIKKHPDYPKQTNEHNALADAKWNKQLYEFLNKL